jgi:hypothetical protein
VLNAGGFDGFGILVGGTLEVSQQAGWDHEGAADDYRWEGGQLAFEFEVGEALL